MLFANQSLRSRPDGGGNHRMSPLLDLAARHVRSALIGAFAALSVLGSAAGARVDEIRSSPGPAAALSARYAALKDEFGNNPFRRPLHLDSTEGRDSVS